MKSPAPDPGGRIQVRSVLKLKERVQMTDELRDELLRKRMKLAYGLLRQAGMETPEVLEKVTDPEQASKPPAPGVDLDQSGEGPSSSS
jgi:hypothetical protein